MAKCLLKYYTLNHNFFNNFCGLKKLINIVLII